MKDRDLVTTILGGVGAAVTAAQPVVNMVQPGTSLHPQDWIQLAMAVIFGLFGFYTNKQNA